MKKIVILHDIRSVYNVGSIFRTADAIGIDEIILTGVTPSPKDRFGRIRSDIAKVSLGAEKMIPWRYVKEIKNVLAELKENNFDIIGIEQSDQSVDYKTIMTKKNTAFLFGNEPKGIPENILSLCDEIAEIPMHGEKESLNVSVAVGIALFRFLDK